MNVIGTRPDGWWRDRDAAMARLVDRLERYSAATGDDVTVVFERKPNPPIRSTVIQIAHARKRGPDAADFEIVKIVEADANPKLDPGGDLRPLAGRPRQRAGRDGVPVGAVPEPDRRLGVGRLGVGSAAPPRVPVPVVVSVLRSRSGRRASRCDELGALRAAIAWSLRARSPSARHGANPAHPQARRLPRDGCGDAQLDAGERAPKPPPEPGPAAGRPSQRQKRLQPQLVLVVVAVLLALLLDVPHVVARLLERHVVLRVEGVAARRRARPTCSRWSRRRCRRPRPA